MTTGKDTNTLVDYVRKLHVIAKRVNEPGRMYPDREMSDDAIRGIVSNYVEEICGGWPSAYSEEEKAYRKMTLTRDLLQMFGSALVTRHQINLIREQNKDTDQ